MKQQLRTPIIIIIAITLIAISVVAWIFYSNQNTSKTESPISPQQNSTYNVADRSDEEYLSRIKKTYPYLSTVKLSVVNKELVQPHWYVVTTHEGDNKIPFKYIFYDDRPNSQALALAAVGLDQPDLPQAADIPDDVLKQIDGGGL